MKRKLFALLLAAAMSLTLLAGCSDTASSGSIAPAASGAGSGAAAQEEPYTVTMMFIGNTQDDEEKVEAAINELTMRDLNMKLDILVVPWANVNEQQKLMLSGGEKLDLMIGTAVQVSNFVSTQAAANNMVGVILTFDITKTTQPDGSASASVGNVHAVPMVMHYDSNYTNARAYLYRDYTEELAAAHGVRARFSGFSKEYITQLLTEYISPEFLVLE